MYEEESTGELKYRKKIKGFIKEIGEVKYSLIAIILLIVISIPIYEFYTNFESIKVDMKEFKIYYVESNNIKKYYFQILYTTKSKNPNIKIYLKNIGVYIDGRRIFEIDEEYKIEILFV